MNEDLIDRLEAEAKVADAEPEELTVAVESDIEQTSAQVEELESEKEDLEAQIEELEDAVDAKESEVEELQDEVEEVSSFYAEELAAASPVMEEEDFQTRYEVGELREKYELLDETEEAEEASEAEPNPESGDPGPNLQTPEGEETEEEVSEELGEAEKVAADAFEQRGGVWGDVAQDIREGENAE